MNSQNLNEYSTVCEFSETQCLLTKYLRNPILDLKIFENLPSLNYLSQKFS